VAFRAQCLKVLDSVHDLRVEDHSSWDTLDVVRLKRLPTAAPSTLPSISIKRQMAVGGIDFTIVRRCKRLDVGRIYDWVVVFLWNAGCRMILADVWIPD
jgi:hypothetical protein